MGQDNQPKNRQKRDLARKQGKRPGHPRLLIVCEDSKSAPGYFREIRIHHRLSTASVEVHKSEDGTAPKLVVTYAKRLFETGDPHKDVKPRAFDEVYAVFDRDDHHSYHDALELAKSLDRKLRNDDKKPVRFVAVASVPCFELWLLLHYEDIQSALHRDEVQRRLRKHLPSYDKGGSGYFQITYPSLAVATKRAIKLASKHDPRDGKAPVTQVESLVTRLCELKNVTGS
jgi:hypothetical protein